VRNGKAEISGSYIKVSRPQQSTLNHYSFTTVSSRYGFDSPREFIFIICKQQNGDIEGFDFDAQQQFRK
jgi:hypothetical protein